MDDIISEDDISYKTLPEIYAATERLDKVKLVPLMYDDGGVTKTSNNLRGVFNISQGKLCAAVAPFYNLVSYKQYIDSFADSLDRLGIPFSMKIAQTPSKCICDINFEGRNLKFENLNEEFGTGIRLVNSYNKSTGLHIMPRFTRLACTNGMIVTRTVETFSIKHSSKMAQEIENIIEKKIAEIISSSKDLQEWVSSSMADSIEWKNICAIIEKLFNQPKHREKILEKLGISMIQVKKKSRKNKVSKTEYSYVMEKEGVEKITRWQLYNCITEYLTHGEQITPFLESVMQKQAEKLLYTKLEKMPMAEIRI